jgi:hypothetical protein
MKMLKKHEKKVSKAKKNTHQRRCNKKNHIEHGRDGTIQACEEEEGEADGTNNTEAIGVAVCGAGGDVPVEGINGSCIRGEEDGLGR